MPLNIYTKVTVTVASNHTLSGKSMIFEIRILTYHIIRITGFFNPTGIGTNSDTS